MSLLITKFQGLNRGLVPLETGALERPLLPFVGTSLVSALIWALSIILPALVIGKLIA